MKKILITGTSGLIGYNLALRLVENCTVYGISRKKVLDHPNYHHIPLDLSLPLDTASLPSGVDAVIHLAQSSRFREFPEQVTDVFNVNTASTLSLLDYARRERIPRFILASTGGVYGSSDSCNEKDPVYINNQLGFYVNSKISAETIANAYTSLLNVITLRFFFVYGDRQERSMLIPRLVNSVLEEKPVSLTGTNGLSINPIHVSDATRAIEKCMELDSSHIINIAGSEVLSLRELTGIIGAKTGKLPVYNVNTELKASNLVADISLMRQLLITPEISFSQGVDGLIPKEVKIKI